MSDQKIEATAAKGNRRSGVEQTRLAVALVAGGIIALFAISNTEKVSVDWVLGSAETPLIFVIVICLLLGVVGGYVAGRRGSRSKQRKHD